MGKKLPAVMAEYRSRFIDGCVANGHPEKLAIEVYEMIEKFAGYGFPKAHSAAYAVIGAQTAYLKANFPVQFMAALMSTEIGSSDRTVVNVAECRRSGIQVLAPDINCSNGDFSVEHIEDVGDVVRFGLVAVRNVGAGVVEHIVQRRSDQPEGKFASVQAFCDAVDWQLVNKRAVESLIKGGAFDALGERAAIMASLDTMVSAVQQRQKAAARGQMDMFGMVAEPIAIGVAAGSLNADVPPADERQKLTWEKEFLGLYMSSHPLSDLFSNGVPEGYIQIGQLDDVAEKQTVRLIGMVTSVRRISTKTNRMMSVVEIEDLAGSIEAVAFPDTYDTCSSLLNADAILDVTAKLDTRGDRRQLIIEQVSSDLPLRREAAQRKDLAPVEIRLPVTREVWSDIAVMQRVSEVMQRHEGTRPVELLLPDGTVTRRFRCRKRCVEWSEDLARDLAGVLGSGRVSMAEDESDALAAVA
jgi:DNA polymerase-3 subunit alpha